MNLFSKGWVSFIKKSTGVGGFSQKKTIKRTFIPPPPYYCLKEKYYNKISTVDTTFKQ